MPSDDSRERKRRCRESDHPFPPWIGGRHAAAAMRAPRRRHVVAWMIATLRYRSTISILLIDASRGSRSLVAISGKSW